MIAWWAVAVGAGLALWPITRPGAGRWAALVRRQRLPGSPAGVAKIHGGGKAPAPSGIGGRSRIVWVASGVLAASLAALTLGPALAVAAVCAIAAVAAPLRAGAVRRARRRYRRDVLTAISVLQGELGAGSPLPAALAQARARAGVAADALTFETDSADAVASPVGGSRTGTDSSRLATSRGDGSSAREPFQPSGADSVADAATSPANRPSLGDGADRRAVRRALRASAAVTMGTGVAWSDVVDGIAADLSSRDARDDALQAALAGTRASMVLLAALPLVGLLLAAGLGAHPVHFLLYSGAGRWVLAVGVALQAAGVLMLLALVRRTER